MTKHYLDNKKFEVLIRDYLDYKGEAINPYEEELMASFDILITTILDSFKFKIDYEDAKQECFLLILKKLRNFTNDKGSAFNFFTTIIINNLKLIYTKKKKYNIKIENYIECKKDTFI